jgi:hypothetical protein
MGGEIKKKESEEISKRVERKKKTFPRGSITFFLQLLEFRYHRLKAGFELVILL